LCAIGHVLFRLVRGQGGFDNGVRGFSMFSKKWFVINLGLLGLAAVLAWQLMLSIDRFKKENELSSGLPVQAALKERAATPAQPAARYNPSDFRTISDQTLFSETRAKEVKEEPAPVAEAVPLKVRPILIGVNISGDHRVATLAEPTHGAAPGSRRGQSKTIGDTYENYTIVDITDTEVVLENGPRRETIALFNAATRSAGQRGRTVAMAPRVVGFGAQRPAQAAPPVSPAVLSAESSRPANAPAPVQTAQATAVVPVVTTNSGTARPVTAGSTPSGRAIDDTTNRRVIRTPFGDVTSFPP
jgi:hypothetical protein